MLVLFGLQALTQARPLVRSPGSDILVRMTDHELFADLQNAERRLQAAMLAGDVDELDALLDDRLIATLAPDLTLVGKQQDLQTHRSRNLVLTSLIEEDLALVYVGSTGVTRVVLSLQGTNTGAPFTAKMLYTRTWNHDDEHGWRVLAAHISPV